MPRPTVRRILTPAVRLVGTPDNPVPAGALASRLTTRDGADLRVARWASLDEEPRGTVAVFPGHAEFIEKYFEVVFELLERGFEVVAMDWRGQGGSARLLSHARKSHIDDFALYREDLETLQSEVLERYCPRPWFGLAHSMGAAILLAAAADGAVRLDRMALVAPMLRIAVIRRHTAARMLAQSLDILGLGTAFVPGGGPTPTHTRPFARNPLTSDPGRYGRTVRIIGAAPELAVGAPTVSWINAAFRFCARLADPELPERIRVPSLLFECGEDTIVDNATIERFGARMKAGGHLYVAGARHELLMEQEVFREQFWGAFDAFIPGSQGELAGLRQMAESRRASAAARRRFAWLRGTRAP